MTKRDTGIMVKVWQDASEERHWKRKIILIRYRWKNMLEIITGESSKGYKKKNLLQNDQKLWINMHKLRGFIMTSDFNFTCML